MTTLDDVLQHRHRGPWRRLESIAQGLTAYTRRHGGSFFSPVLGGGTRLMLALNHRISDDIDLFVDSPGWLPYVSPRLNDTHGTEPISYTEDADHVKWRFPFGEIDFIVRTNLLDPKDLWNPTAPETKFPLEPPLEVLAKKLFYRGWALTPRDLFDWHAIETAAVISDANRASLAGLLSTKTDEIEVALNRMREKKVVRQSWEKIKAPIIPEMNGILDWAHEQILCYRRIVDGGQRRD